MSPTKNGIFSKLYLLTVLELKSHFRKLEQIVTTIMTLVSLAFVFSYISFDFMDGSSLSSLQVSLAITVCLIFLSIMIYGQNILGPDINSGRLSLVFSQGVVRPFLVAKIISFTLILSGISYFGITACYLFLGIKIKALLYMFIALVLSFPFVIGVLLFSQLLIVNLSSRTQGHKLSESSVIILSFLLCLPLLIAPMLLCVGFALFGSLSILVGIIGLNFIMVPFIIIFSDNFV